MFFHQFKFFTGKIVNEFRSHSIVFKNCIIKTLEPKTLRNFSTVNHSFDQNVSSKSTGIHDTISSINVKKRIVRKKKTLEDEVSKPGIYNVIAFATAEEYNLKCLVNGLEQQDLYEPKIFENLSDIIHATAKYPVDKEPREIFFFKDGMLRLINLVL